MKLKEARAFRKDRATELRRLAEILHNARLVRDAKPLYEAADACGRGQGELTWAYNFVGLEFDLAASLLRHSRPRDAELDSVELSVSLDGPCLDENSGIDPFTTLNVSILVRGLDSDNNDLAISWHLDKHKDKSSEFYHPDYHFHCGGQKIWDCETNILGFSYGSLLLLESPRLEHKPLDGILAVDFVLGNFLGPAWQELKMGDGRYEELIQAAEKRCHLACAAASLARLKI